MVFLVCAGLFVKAVGQSSSIEAGFDTRKAFTLFMGFDADLQKARAVQNRLADELRRSPGIESVALLDRFPFAGTWSPPVVVDANGQRLATRTLANYVCLPPTSKRLELPSSVAARSAKTKQRRALPSRSSASPPRAGSGQHRIQLANA
jgi:hypothetical protein